MKNDPNKKEVKILSSKETAQAYAKKAYKKLETPHKFFGYKATVSLEPFLLRIKSCSPAVQISFLMNNSLIDKALEKDLYAFMDFFHKGREICPKIPLDKFEKLLEKANITDKYATIIRDILVDGKPMVTYAKGRQRVELGIQQLQKVDSLNDIYNASALNLKKLVDRVGGENAAILMLDDLDILEKKINTKDFRLEGSYSSLAFLLSNISDEKLSLILNSQLSAKAEMESALKLLKGVTVKDILEFTEKQNSVSVAKRTIFGQPKYRYVPTIEYQRITKILKSFNS